MSTAPRVTRPARWDEPFGSAALGEQDVARLLQVSPFNRIDAAAFPPALPLAGVLSNDCRLRHFASGDIVVRQGDYGNSAFFVLSGGLRVLLAGEGNDLPGDVLGRVEPRRKSWREALAQLWGAQGPPEARELQDLPAGTGVGRRPGAPDELHVFLQDVPTALAEHRTARIESGSFFGEIAALGRSPRTATVFAEQPSELLEIRWQGLRDIRKRSPEIRAHVDALYRKHSLETHLRMTPLFAHLSPEELAEVARETLFETYGEFDWYASYKALAQQGAQARLEQEPVIAGEGHYPNGLVLIRSGFARLCERHHSGERTVRYLGKGEAYGLEELVHNWRSQEARPLQRSLRAVGYVDVLLVPTHVLERLVFPGVPRERLPTAQPESPLAAQADEALPQGLLEFFAENRVINGTAAMLIDLERCVRCDDCVTACATTHEGNPRFLRHGPRHGRFQVANACMHCVDPVCMIGCPTGAIQRDEAGGLVLINERTCIGCATCAESCPYENIRMVEARDARGAFVLDRESHLPIQKATKCDLCREQPSGPACVQACPHDALLRADMRDLSGLARWIRER